MLSTLSMILYYIFFRTNKAQTIQGYARLTGGPTEGRLGVVFPNMPFASEAPYWVLDTDYDNFAVVYSCTNIGFIKTGIASFTILLYLIYVTITIHCSTLKIINKAINDVFTNYDDLHMEH